MIERKFYTIGTLDLLCEWYTITHKRAKLTKATWITNPIKKISCIGGFRERRSRSKLENITGMISRRYKPILTEVFFVAYNDISNFKQFFIEFMLLSQRFIHESGSYEQLPGIMWKVCTNLINSEVHILKPKFMLIPFINEMPNDEDRGILIALAYGSYNNQISINEELEIKLNSAYAVFHQALLKHSDKIEILSDSIIDSDTLENLSEPFVEYDNWLFPNC
jgi:hypothetical protein